MCCSCTDVECRPKCLRVIWWRCWVRHWARLWSGFQLKSRLLAQRRTTWFPWRNSPWERCTAFTTTAPQVSSEAALCGWLNKVQVRTTNYFLYCCVFRPQLAASHHPPKEPAGLASVPSGTLSPLQSSYVHHHLPQTLPPPGHGAGRSAPPVRAKSYLLFKAYYEFEFMSAESLFSALKLVILLTSLLFRTTVSFVAYCCSSHCLRSFDLQGWHHFPMSLCTFEADAVNWIPRREGLMTEKPGVCAFVGSDDERTVPVQQH